MHKIIRKVGLAAVILVTFFLIFYFSRNNLSYLTDPLHVKELILSAGYLAPLVLIVLQAFQAMISIFPSQLTTVAAGFIFGPFLGLFYSLVGALLGSTAVFLIAKKFGGKMMAYFFDRKETIHFRKMFSKHGDSALFIARVIPLFPNDLASIAAGLTTMRYPTFLFYSTLGFLAQMIILTLFGSQLSDLRFSTPLLVTGLIIILLFLVVVFREKMKLFLIKDIKSIEEEIIRLKGKA
mgnify:CR=1 FL=1